MFGSVLNRLKWQWHLHRLRRELRDLRALPRPVANLTPWADPMPGDLADPLPVLPEAPQPLPEKSVSITAPPAPRRSARKATTRRRPTPKPPTKRLKKKRFN